MGLQRGELRTAITYSHIDNPTRIIVSVGARPLQRRNYTESRPYILETLPLETQEHQFFSRTCDPVTIVALRLVPAFQIPRPASRSSSVKKRANGINVLVKLMSLIFILAHLLLSGVLQSLTASQYGQISG